MGMQTICPTIHVQSLTNYANKQADKQTEISAPDSGSSQLTEILYGHACMCLFERFVQISQELRWSVLSI